MNENEVVVLVKMNLKIKLKRNEECVEQQVYIEEDETLFQIQMVWNWIIEQGREGTRVGVRNSFTKYSDSNTYRGAEAELLALLLERESLFMISEFSVTLRKRNKQRDLNLNSQLIGLC